MTLPHPSAPPSTPILYRGHKVGLGPLTREMIPLYYQWLNDQEFCMWGGDSFTPHTLASVEEHTERVLRDRSPHTVSFGIYDLETMAPIGFCLLRHIFPEEGLAEYGIGIGDKRFWGRGYGTEATILTLDYGFSVLGAHNIMLTTADYNARAIRAYEKAGFRVIGRRREARKVGRQRYDVVLMDCLASEFESPLPPVVPQPPRQS